MALSGSVGSYQEFGYTGGMQSVTIPADGIYKLECYGAQGGTTTNVWAGGGNGGYSCGYKELKKGAILYVCVGGAGDVHQGGQGTSSYIYNGGGYGRATDGASGAGSGGGATHIATTDRGVLSNYNSYRNEVLIVAGGGGGAAYCSNYYNAGGGSGNSSSGNGTFGQGSSVEGNGRGSAAAGGGGGGYYGGWAKWKPVDTELSGGGGGTGYTGGVPEFSFNGTTYTPSMSSGVRGGHGYAKITFAALSKIYKLNVDGSVAQTVYLDGVALEQIKFDGVSVFGNP